MAQLNHLWLSLIQMTLLIHLKHKQLPRINNHLMLLNKQLMNLRHKLNLLLLILLLQQAKLTKINSKKHQQIKSLRLIHHQIQIQQLTIKLKSLLQIRLRHLQNKPQQLKLPQLIQIDFWKRTVVFIFLKIVNYIS